LGVQREWGVTIEFYRKLEISYINVDNWWYRTMLNFYPPFLCRVLAAILKMADILKIFKMQNCSSNGDLSLCQILCLYHNFYWSPSSKWSPQYRKNSTLSDIVKIWYVGR
jgi:hypothetical protein